MLVRPRLEKASPTLAAHTFLPGILQRPNGEPWLRHHDAEPSRPSKRLRLKSDVDGESSGDLQIKKRRLRRYLITSRLSKPYATPSTYIHGPDNMKLVTCGRTSGGTRNLMRKIAHLNSVRQRTSYVTRPSGYPNSINNAKAKLDDLVYERPNNNTSEESSENSSVTTFGSVGISNYDALDLEGNIYVDDPWVDCEDEIPDSEYDRNDDETLVESSEEDIHDVDASTGSIGCVTKRSNAARLNGFE